MKDNTNSNLAITGTPLTEAHSLGFTESNNNETTLSVVSQTEAQNGTRATPKGQALAAEIQAIEAATENISTSAVMAWILQQLNDARQSTDFALLWAGREARKIQDEYANQLPQFVLLREALERVEQEHFAGLQGLFNTDFVAAISAGLSAENRTGRAHLDYIEANHDEGIPGSLVSLRSVAESAVRMAESWSGPSPACLHIENGNAEFLSDKLRTAHLFVEAIGTAAQTLRVELAKVEAQAAGKGVRL